MEELPHNSREVSSADDLVLEPTEPTKKKEDNFGNNSGIGFKPLTEIQNKEMQPLVEESYNIALSSDISSDINGSKSVQPTLDYFPSKKQLLFFKKALESEKYEITAIAEAAGINRNAWYQWIDDPKFVKWYNTMWQRALDSNAWKLDIMGLKQAKNNFKYWKAMQQRSGRLLDTYDRSTSVNLNNFKVDFIMDE